MKSRPHLLRITVILVGVLFIAAFAGASAYNLWRQRSQMFVSSERELGNLSKALSEEAARSLQTVDLLLRDTSSWYELTGRKLPPEAIDSTLAALNVAIPQVRVLTIVDAQGMQRHRSRATGEPLANVADRPYFEAQREAKATGLFINEPIVTRTEGSRALVMSRRLSDAQGNFAGAVTAIVTLEDLQHTYEKFDLGEHSELFLTFDDGKVIVSLPANGGTPPRRLPELAKLALKDGQSAREISVVDGRMKVVAATDVGGEPLVVVLTRDQAEILRPWRDEVINSVLRTLILVAVAIVAIAAILRQLRQLEANALALQQSEARYAMAMDAANEGHAEWNLTENTVFLSSRWRALHNVPESAPELTVDDLRELIAMHSPDRVQAAAALKDHLEGRTPAVEIEYRIRCPGADWRWIYARGRCLRDAAGVATRVFWAATDISRRKQAEAEKVLLESQLQQGRHLESLGTMAGGIAHDFNNILGAILGYGEMAQREAPASSALQRHIDQVMLAGQRAKALVKKILDFSRSGYAERLPVCVQDVVEEVLAMLPSILPAHVTLQARLAAPLLVVQGNMTGVHQVVMNLCTNAAQAMQEPGVLRVTLDTIALQREQILTHGRLPAGAYVRLGVSDTGSGISPETYARMFDPFFTTKTVGSGTGLGLSVVHSVVADFGGAIDVSSEPGVSTVFHVWLPTIGQSFPSAPRGDGPLPCGNGQVVMVVDDEPALVEVAEESLASLGYEAVGYSSGESALKAFIEAPDRFDAVLTDEKLPHMLGTELARQIKALRPDIPVIVMSGYGGEDLEERVRAAGVAELLHKPLVMGDIAAALQRVLP